MNWKCSSFSFDLGMPIIMGILNVTPDSFSDGGSYASVDEACERARQMVAEGASIIDVGGESTRSGSAPVSEAEEIERVAEVVRRLAAEGICVSIDTRHATVAKAALEAGASIINDVSGFRDAAMVQVACESDAGLVVMHMQGEPGTMQDNPTYTDVVSEVRNYLANQAQMLVDAGIDPSRICVDPGPGFGKTPQQTVELMRNLQEFVHLGYPVMAAPSRKSYVGFVYGIDDPAERDVASAAEALLACELGATVLRMHNVAKTAEALKDLRPRVVLGLGCNQVQALPEDATPDQARAAKIDLLNQAVGQMLFIPDTEVIDVSPFYQSEPAYYEDQDVFVNAVCVLRCGVPPKELLEYLHAIENNLGRVRTIENGPRTCDIDILDYQMYVVESDILTLPHALLLERDFTVKPLLDVLPGHVLANGVAVVEKALPEAERVGRAFRI